ncbi:hypothetical protein PPL_07164 [Heterostelium album PN500]|uniref:Phosphoribosyltransferase domain-containing protein n=1 Tax=Heterostelium pallidum (strain ATCC 26659 / Pp 5 / PN500) TaxID=670386 RepID=D3BEK0_HETP5|nr:hypothetical protein PPL_07164 [Heterostelium album PN500]EFA80331.1 hypothetical protein PPL_07164 [Heterostelium album PN500]|eukprot:XP_020432451.1 hypothetical protein PPL_07164 [Heterostelium album PN500]
MFKDRKDAGQKLRDKLLNFKGVSNTVVVGLPRGGVPVAFEIANDLSLPLDIVVPRKIGAPFNKEYAIGAIAEDGKAYFDREAIEHLGVSTKYLESEMEKQRAESKRRLRVYRGERPPVDFKDKTILLVDDGIATGSTVKAAIESLKVHHPKEIIVAVPVGPQDTISELKESINQVICLATPHPFNAVGCFYSFFDQTDDDTVIEMMKHKPLTPSQ